jgi:hypothetical protein
MAGLLDSPLMYMLPGLLGQQNNLGGNLLGGLSAYAQDQQYSDKLARQSTVDAQNARLTELQIKAAQSAAAKSERISAATGRLSAYQSHLNPPAGTPVDPSQNAYIGTGFSPEGDAILVNPASNTSPGGSYGVTPIYTRGPNGNLQAWQADSSGNLRLMDFGDGVKPVRPVNFQDVGGQLKVYGYGSSTPVVPDVPKTLPPQDTVEHKGDVAQEVAERGAQGGLNVAAIDEYDTSMRGANYLLANLDGLIDHPGMPLGVGGSSWVPALPGTDLADFVTRHDQVKGAAFLQAYQALKGGGPITDIEGKKAEEAVARLNRAQTEKEFVNAVKEFQVEIRKLMAIARKKAFKTGGGGGSTAQPGGNNGTIRYGQGADGQLVLLP